MNNSSFDRFSELDMKAFNFIASQPSLFNLLVHSVCPSIYGQELVKAGILLCLAGGVSMENRRGNIHVLMVGDPGLGKSQLLRAASALSPRKRTDRHHGERQSRNSIGSRRRSRGIRAWKRERWC